MPRRDIPRAGTTVGALVCLGALLTGCTVGPSERPPVAVRGENMVPPVAQPSTAPTPPEALPQPEPQRSSIPFVDCTGDALPTPPPDRALRVECGEITVPTDPDRPELGRSLLGVLRVAAADAPADRPPLLVLGDSDTEPSAVHALTLATRVPPELLESFTLIGLDRRGSGLDALDCAPAAARAAVVDADPIEITEASLNVLLEDARAVVQGCYLVRSGAFGGYRSAAAAVDVDQLRARLGVDRMSAIGVGDGATALAAWARTAPQSVARLVLDGLPDPTLDEPERSGVRAAAAEVTFDSFATACAVRVGCPLGADPRAAVTALVAQLRAQPLPASDGRRLTAGSALTALLAGLGEPDSWTGLAGALAAARDGDPTGLLAVLDPAGDRFDAALATRCNDATRRLAPGEIAELVDRWRVDRPLFGGTLTLGLLACAPWPAISAPAVTGPPRGLPPILVIGTARDPRGPLDGPRRTAAAMPTARFLSWQGAGTGAYPRTPCVTGVVGEMLVDGVVPRPETLCPP